MAYVLIVEPQAEVHLQIAYWDYEVKKPSLGEQFLLCADAAFDRAKRNPLVYPPVHRDLRRILIRRFPFATFYFLDKREVHVLAVFPCAINPETWKALR